MAQAEVRLKKAKKLSETMRKRSLSDSLTNLPNRRAFYGALDDCKKAADATTNSWIVLLDLDGFKSVNDNYGHGMGDGLLIKVASRLRDHCKGKAHVSRVGGDEFSIVIKDPTVAKDIDHWCRTLLENIAEVYLIDDRLIQISGSIGCYKFANDEDDAKILHKVDYALLEAKRSGKNRVVLFDETHARQSNEMFRIEQALRIADFSSEIQLVFQPQYDLGRQKLSSAEALARWHSPSIGSIEPDRFIKIAEDTGLIAKITVAVLAKAIDALKGWDNPIPISINLSGNDLMSDQIIDTIIGMLDASKIHPDMIEFEVTETALMADTDKATANLTRLSKRGHSIALDDFGTGYSNFTYLRSLPINKLKVDKSFLTNLADPMAEKVLHSLVGLARTLGVHCLLEGVADELDLVVAKRVGAQSVQGYLIGYPTSANELNDLFKAQTAASRHSNMKTPRTAA